MTTGFLITALLCFIALSARAELTITNNLVLWLDASDAETVKTNRKGMVRTWHDKSGHNRHAKGVLSSMRPILGKRSLNELPVIDFTRDELHVKRLNLSQPDTIFVVAKRDTFAQNGRGSYIYSGINTNKTQEIFNYRGQYGSKAGNWDSGLVTGQTRDAAEIHTNIWNGDQSYHYVNGKLNGTGNAGEDALGGLLLGNLQSSTSSGKYLDGFIAEILIYTGILSDKERKEVENYLSQKWGIPLESDNVENNNGSENSNNEGDVGNNGNDLPPSEDTNPNDVSTPCSLRYQGGMVEFPLNTQDIGKHVVDSVYDSWNVLAWYSGKENFTIEKAPLTGEPAIKAFYKQHNRLGGNWVVSGGIEEENLQSACLRYQVYFPEGFEYQRGGKLPGIYGGLPNANGVASGCQNGVEETGFSMRYMWREHGMGSLYGYHPGKDGGCGQYYGIGSFNFDRLEAEPYQEDSGYPRTGMERWVTLEQEVVLNDVGKENGVVRIWADGTKVIEQDMTLRVRDDVTIRGFYFSTFFGGSHNWPECSTDLDSCYVTLKDQNVYFKDFELFRP